MANPSKQKGTAAETELRRLLEESELTFRRTTPGTMYDLTNEQDGRFEVDPLEVLATRPDRGEWLITMRLSHFATLLRAYGDWETHIEAKRYSRFSLHTIFAKKFGGKRGR